MTGGLRVVADALTAVLAACEDGQLPVASGGDHAAYRELVGARTALEAAARRLPKTRLQTKRPFGILRPVRVAGYVRVSTAEQADKGAGLTAQRVAIEAACLSRGWTLVEVFEDGGLSGKTIKRPGLDAALSLIEGGGADGLVVSKVDRLSRSLLDFAALMHRAEQKRWAILVLDLGVDTSTPTGEMTASIIAAAAQYERRLIGQRTREALAVRRSQGVRLGRPPKVPERVVKRIVALRTEGMTYAAIAEQLNVAGEPTAQGGTRWYPATVRKISQSTKTT